MQRSGSEHFQGRGQRSRGPEVGHSTGIFEVIAVQYGG